MSPCKKLESYETPLCHFSNGGKNGKITKNSGLRHVSTKPSAQRRSDQFPLTPMGVLAPVSAHAGPSAQPPIGTSTNFLARVSAESISPNSLFF